MDSSNVATVQHRFNKGSAVERKRGNSFQFRLKDNKYVKDHQDVGSI